MKTKTIITNIAIALSLGIIYTGCKKDKDNEATPSTSTTTTTTTSTTSTESANSVAESSFTEIFKSLSEISEGNAGLRSSCATITIDSIPFLSFPKTVTIDYGSSGCSGKTGKLTAVFTGKYGAVGTIITITADSNYTINSHKIKVGTHTITSGLSNNSAGHKTFNLSVVGGSIGLPGGSVSWTSNRSITWIAGDSTLDPTDDVYQITGTSSGTNMNGDVFTSTISTPLTVANSCPWIESGVITITTFNKKTRSIDFGSGACDNKATVTLDTTTYNINL
jgi:hypothetical protein